jgi:hypothetical protein
MTLLDRNSAHIKRHIALEASYADDFVGPGLDGPNGAGRGGLQNENISNILILYEQIKVISQFGGNPDGTLRRKPRKIN